MEIDRRSLMKSMLAGGAMLALGTPPWGFASASAERFKRCMLVLGGTGSDEMFAAGASAACAGMTGEGLQIVKLTGGLLTGTERMGKLLDQSRGARWIAVMDDASSVIFVELARTAGVRLLSMGTHASTSDRSCPLRHVWVTTSPDYSAGGLLASHISQGQNSFWITERFLQERQGDGAVTSWSAPGFSSYRFTGPEAIHMHYSGLSLTEGFRLLGLKETGKWSPIPPQVCTRDSVAWQSESWVESVGYAVTASALGAGSSVRESCASRVFVHQSQKSKSRQPRERFVSFVIDI